MKKYFSVFILSVILLSSCQKDLDSTTPIDSFDPTVAKVLKDESFGTDAAQKADVHLPANRSSATKVLLVLHGGSWAAGDKTDLDSFILMLKASYPEAAIVNMNYRLATNTANKYPTQIEDITKALDHVISKKDIWHVSSNIGLGGVSAGGQLALMYAYKYDVTKRIKCVISVVGPTNFIDAYYLTNPLFQLIATNYIGVPISDIATYKNASPAWMVTAAAPPTFMAYAGADELVPETNATFLKQQLTTLGVPYQYNFYPTEGHVFSNPRLAETAIKITAFAKLYL